MPSPSTVRVSSPIIGADITSSSSPNAAVLAAVCLGAAILAGAMIGWLLRKVAAPGPRQPSNEHVAPDHAAHLRSLSLTSQRMILALHEDEIRRIATDEAIVMGNADSGAFVSLDGGHVTFRCTTHAAAFSSGELVSGVVVDAIAAGQPRAAVVDHDPAVAEPPVSIAVVPVTVASGVAGAIVVLRPANEPFVQADLDRIGLLAPVTGAALVTSRAQSRQTPRAEGPSKPHARTSENRSFGRRSTDPAPSTPAQRVDAATSD